MTEKRVLNFSAGPSMLPEPVLEKAAKQMLNYENSGMSVMEMSHRSLMITKLCLSKGEQHNNFQWFH